MTRSTLPPAAGGFWTITDNPDGSGIPISATTGAGSDGDTDAQPDIRTSDIALTAIRNGRRFIWVPFGVRVQGVGDYRLEVGESRSAASNAVVETSST